jgi:hypothetical protein
VLRPGWRLVPVLAADQIEAAIAIDVGDRGRFAGTRIDRVDFEREVRRAATLAARPPQCRKGSGGKVACV